MMLELKIWLHTHKIMAPKRSDTILPSNILPIIIIIIIINISIINAPHFSKQITKTPTYPYIQSDVS